MDTIQNGDYFNTDAYLRLSKEDGDKDESDSITNQRELIMDFVKSKPEIRIHKIRVDDGYSGVNFDRPAFQEMMEDIKKGEVNCVITKDLSRFGRNHIEAGKYIEKIFPYLGVRFIAINDNYDSLQNNSQNNIIVPFKNLINDAYCRDISIKIRTNLEVKRKKGDFVGAFAPYGYRKSDRNKNKLEIDEEASAVVSNIFCWYLHGNSAYKIADMLNKEDILTPMDYKRSNGSSFYTGFKKSVKGKWDHMMVLRILSNPVYAGTLVQGKETTPNYKVKKRIQRDRNSWNCVENTHENIVSQLNFDSVQNLLRIDTRTGISEEKVYCLSGFVKCADCGAPMVRKNVPSGGKKYVYFVCSSHKSNKEICSAHSIRADYLEESILKLINFQIENIVDMETVLKGIDQERKKEGIRAKKEKQLQKKKDALQWNYRLKLELYEDYKSEIITKEEYTDLKNLYEERIQTAERAIESLNEEINLMDYSPLYTEWLDELEKHRNLEKLTRETVAFLIDEVRIFEKRPGERNARIEVKFKFEDERNSITTFLNEYCCENAGQEEVQNGKGKQEE